MQHETRRLVVTAALAAVLAGGAGAAVAASLDDDSTTAPVADDPTAPTETGSVEPSPTGAAPPEAGRAPVNLPWGGEEYALDPTQLTTRIENRYWPMTPGTRWTSVEIDVEGNRLDVVVTVTSETRKIANGVTARVVRDTVSDHGAVVEDTKDWYAQDADGNVWYLGENTAEFAGGKVASRAGSWEAGVDGALAGVVVPADPAPGLRYREEYYAGEAEDSGEVLSVDEQVQTPAGHHTGVLLTKGTNALEPRTLEYKLYAPGIGPALALDVSGGAGREQLVKVDRVSRQGARRAGTSPLGEPYP